MAVSIVFLIASCMIMVLCVVVMILIGRWVYKDAKKKGLPAAMWTAVAVLMPSLVGLLIYIVYRADKKPTMICKSCERSIELNVSFCPYCGYQSPPVETVLAAPTSSKGLLALIIIPAVLMFFAIIGVMGIIGIATFTHSGSSYAYNTATTSVVEEVQSPSYSISVGPLDINTSTADNSWDWDMDMSDSSWNWDMDMSDNSWDWDMESYPYEQDETVYESYSDGSYALNKKFSDTDFVATYNIPDYTQELSIAFYCRGNADFKISPEPLKSPESYSIQSGGGNTSIIYVYDASALSESSISFTVSPKNGESIYDISICVTAD